MSRSHPKCNADEHRVCRRRFLGTMGLGTTAVVANMNPWTGLCSDAAAAQATKNAKRLIFIWLQGGWSHFETWDPKPGTPTGGPYIAIPTSVPGIQISELLPKTAGQMQHIAVLRGISHNAEFDRGHKGGSPLTGRKQIGGGRGARPDAYPTLAEIATRALHQADSKVPLHVELQMEAGHRWEDERGPVSYLGPKYAPLVMNGGKRPPNFDRHPAITDRDHHDRELLRSLLSKNFQKRRSTPRTNAYDQAHARVRGVMACDQLLDIDQAPQADLDRYGPVPFARHCLQARRLIEAGVPVVKIRDTWWDTHADNFIKNHNLCMGFDHGFSLLIEDLRERGLLDSTLVVTLSEFGRTPRIDAGLGRDHYTNAWSVTVAGGGIAGGAVYGKTDPTGANVVDGMATPADLFATYFHALGIDPHEQYYADGRPVDLLETDGKVIEELFT